MEKQRGSTGAAFMGVTSLYCPSAICQVASGTCVVAGAPRCGPVLGAGVSVQLGNNCGKRLFWESLGVRESPGRRTGGPPARTAGPAGSDHRPCRQVRVPLRRDARCWRPRRPSSQLAVVFERAALGHITHVVVRSASRSDLRSYSATGSWSNRRRRPELELPAADR